MKAALVGGMKRPLQILLPLIAAATLYSAPAEACSPPQPGLYDTFPLDGMTYPANGSVLFGGYGIHLGNVGVTVDGAPAALVQPNSEDAMARLASIVAQVEPQPLAGQLVVISGTFCDDDFGNCEPTTISYTASEPDEIAPSAAGFFEVTYDVYDHTQTDAGVGSCQGNSGVHYYLHVDSNMNETLGDSTTPVFWVVTGSSNSAADPSFQYVYQADSPTLDVSLAFDDIAVVDAPEICVDVALMDAAGNVLGVVADSCSACMYRNDDDGSTDGTAFIDEPAWTSADAYPGGLCAQDFEPPINPPGDDPTNNDGDTRVTSGCGCTTAGGDNSGAGWLFALLGAALTVTRRRKND
jgi:MYXO-CTERM domain-containing protein